MGNGKSETLKQIQTFLDGNENQSPNNIFNLFDNKDTPHKDQLIQIFSTLPYSQAQQIYKLFNAMPDVRDAWNRALEIRIEKQQVEIDHLSSQVHALDKDLTELLDKYTDLHGSHSDFKLILETIVKKNNDIYFSSEDISTDAEAELLEKNNEIAKLAQQALKKD